MLIVVNNMAGIADSSPGGAACASPMIEILEAKSGPNGCPVSSPLSLTIKFRAGGDVAKCHWAFAYVVDIVYRQEKVGLGRTEERDLAAGEHEVSHMVENIPLEGKGGV